MNSEDVSLIRNALLYLEEVNSRFLQGRALGFIEAILVKNRILNRGAKFEYLESYKEFKFFCIKYRVDNCNLKI